jgi:uncharacterized repeat protein (TIGR03803 family)
MLPNSGAETVLYSFGGSQHNDGALPFGDLLADLKGNLYGTTLLSSVGEGVAFILTPPAPGTTTWTESVIARFYGFAEPSALVAGPQSGLYGTQYGGGGSGCNTGCGLVFQLRPPPPGQKLWRFATLYTFRGPPDGGVGGNALIADGSGGFYGTTNQGGTGSCGPFGCGVAFELSPPPPGKTAWTEKVLYSFGATVKDGQFPVGQLVSDASGNLYGMTSTGGAFGKGTVFELMPPRMPNGPWTERVLHSFQGGVSDGANPGAGVILGSGGTLYGTTIRGGVGGGSIGNGTAFSLTPPPGGRGAWSETILHAFTGSGGDGSWPSGRLVLYKSGALYGMTQLGGTVGYGTVFKLTPPTPGHSTWTELPYYSFKRGTADGGQPGGGLTIGRFGFLYGTTTNGGTYDNGTIFKVLP